MFAFERGCRRIIRIHSRRSCRLCQTRQSKNGVTQEDAQIPESPTGPGSVGSGLMDLNRLMYTKTPLKTVRKGVIGIRDVKIARAVGVCCRGMRVGCSIVFLGG